MTAPRWLSWALLGLAAVLVPWIGLLIAFNPATATAFHVHLATLGLGAASVAAAVTAAAGFLRGALWAAPAALSCATLAGAGAIGVLVTTEASWTRIALIGVACAAVAAAAAHGPLAGARGPDRVPGRSAAIALAAVALATCAQTAFFLAEEPRSLTAHHVRLAWVWLDVAELVSLAVAGLALRRGAARGAVVAGSVGATLLLMDAWVNVTLVSGGAPLAWALAFALVGELPSAALCTWAARAGLGALEELRLTGPPLGGSPHSPTGASTTAARATPCDGEVIPPEENR